MDGVRPMRIILPSKWLMPVTPVDPETMSTMYSSGPQRSLCGALAPRQDFTNDMISFSASSTRPRIGANEFALTV